MKFFKPGYLIKVWNSLNLPNPNHSRRERFDRVSLRKLENFQQCWKQKIGNENCQKKTSPCLAVNRQMFGICNISHVYFVLVGKPSVRQRQFIKSRRCRRYYSWKYEQTFRSCGLMCMKVSTLKLFNLNSWLFLMAMAPKRASDKLLIIHVKCCSQQMPLIRSSLITRSQQSSFPKQIEVEIRASVQRFRCQQSWLRRSEVFQNISKLFFCNLTFQISLVYLNWETFVICIFSE